MEPMRLKTVGMNLFGGAILGFGLYHVHSLSNLTEGGTLGLVLLLAHWFRISPGISGAVLNLICYGIGWKTLGKGFIFHSMLATVGFSGMYGICEQFDHLWPRLAAQPLLAAILGALFVGVGVGLCVRAGGAPSGDDALAMSIQARTGVQIQWLYLISDVTVLLLSLSYIPWERIGYSLLTVILSGQIIGLFQRK